VTIPLARRALDGYTPIGVFALLVGSVVSATSRPEPSFPGVYPAVFDVRLRDINLFADAGNALLRGDVAAVYADPVNQAGPAQVVADAWIVNLTQYGVFPSAWYVVQALIAALVLFACGAGIRAVTTSSSISQVASVTRVGPLVTRWFPYVAVVLLAIWNVPIFVYISGHWWQLLVMAGWIAGGVLLLRGRPVWAGVVMASGVAWEPWAVFGGFFVLWASRWRDAFYYAGSSLAVGAAVWGVFVIQPGFAFTEYEWMVRPDSWWALTVDPGSPFPWTARLSQTVIVAGVVTAGAWMVRRQGALSPVSGSWGAVWWCVWLSTLIVSARISTDVWFGPYYYAPVTVGLLLLLAGALAAGAWLPAGLLTIGVVLTFTGSLVWGPFVAATGIVLLLLVAGWIAATRYTRVAHTPNPLTQPESETRPTTTAPIK